MRRRVWASLGALLLSITLLGGSVSAQVPVQPQQATLPPQQVAGGTDSAYGSYLPIAPGDLVQVTVFGASDLSGRYRVSPAGDVNLILAGRLHVTGMNSDAVATEIETLFRSKDILKDPHVNVFVQEYLSQGVTILGEVKNPGVYPSLGEHRLYDLIASAGGFTASASNRITLLHAGKPNQPEMMELSNMGLTDGAHNVPLAPGDRVIVATGGIVYVLGDVGRAGGYVLSRTDPQLTVVKALSLAGGFNHTAKTSAASILTQTASGIQHQDFDIKKVLDRKQPDLELHAGDVLYIPASNAKIIGYRAIEAAFTAATEASVYVFAP